MERLILLISISFLIGFSGCINKIDIPTDDNPVSEGEVPDGFDFRMTYPQEIEIKAVDEDQLPMKRLRFFIFSAPPETGGKIMASGLTDAGGYYRTTVEVSTHQEALYAYTPYLDLTRAQRLELVEKPIKHSWGSEPLPSTGLSYRIAIDTTFGCDPSFYQVIGKDFKKLDVVSGTYMTMGSASSNYNGIGYNDEDGMIYGFKRNGGNVNLWRLNPNGEESDLGRITSQSANYAGGHYKGDFDLKGNLYSVSGSYLGRLDVDSLPLTAYEERITFLNGANSTIHDIAYNETFDKFYTVNMSGQIMSLDHQTAIMNKLGDFGHITGTTSAFGAVWCISSGELFFSQNATGNIYRADLDSEGIPTRVELQLVGESTNNNDGAGCVKAESPFFDTDDDGIPNGNDDYPDDGEVAYASYTPDRLGYGTYAFEDLWPSKGDYDFNDLVMDYNYEAARDTNNDIHWLIMNFRLRALGASYQTGFGIQLDDLLPNQVASVTGSSSPSISVGANGCENGQSAAVIIVTDNAHENFGVPVGRFVNTGLAGMATKTPVDIQLTITFSEPVSELGTVNPFIITRGSRGHEIHLMGYQPTDLVADSLFDTASDVSGDGTYYADSDGYPWGMHFPVSFDFPIEKVPIRESYTQFDSWVRSRGLQQTDWYSPAKARREKVIIQ